MLYLNWVLCRKKSNQLKREDVYLSDTGVLALRSVMNINVKWIFWLSIPMGKNKAEKCGVLLGICEWHLPDFVTLGVMSLWKFPFLGWMNTQKYTDGACDFMISSLCVYENSCSFFIDYEKSTFQLSKWQTTSAVVKCAQIIRWFVYIYFPVSQVYWRKNMGTCL